MTVLNYLATVAFHLTLFQELDYHDQKLPADMQTVHYNLKNAQIYPKEFLLSKNLLFLKEKYKNVLQKSAKRL